MSTGEMLLTAGRLALGSGLLAAGGAISPEVSVPYLGVPINVVVAASAGAVAGFAFAGKLESRLRVFQVAFASVVLGCAITTLLELYMTYKLGWEVETRALPAIALIVACVARWLVPAVIERIGPWLDSLPFVKPKGK